jgi:hypothetical protein
VTEIEGEGVEELRGIFFNGDSIPRSRRQGVSPRIGEIGDGTIPAQCWATPQSRWAWLGVCPPYKSTSKIIIKNIFAVNSSVLNVN